MNTASGFRKTCVHLSPADGSVKQRSHCGEQFGSSTKSETQNYHMTWNSTPPYRLKKNENRCSDRNMYMNVHSTTAEIAKRYKQPTGHPSNEEWIKNVVCLYNGLLFGCKKNKIPIDATVGINFAQWRSQTQKFQHCMTSYIGNIQNRQDSYRQKADQWLPRQGGRWRMIQDFTFDTKKEISVDCCTMLWNVLNVTELWHFKMVKMATCLEVHWLELCVFIAEGVGLTPG